MLKNTDIMNYKANCQRRMKCALTRLLTCFIIALLFPQSLTSQSCLPEGITFATQAQIDSFQINHPGCSEIEGKVSIGGDNISNLNGLNILTAIGGDLWISNNDSLNTLTGLNNLISVGGDISIGGVDGLLNLNGFDNLSSINGMLEISFNNGLISLSGIDSLAYIGDRLHISYNPELVSLSGLENLASIDGDLYVYDNIELLELAGLNNIVSIGGVLIIVENPSLTSLSGLQNVTSIGGTLNIENNDALQTLSGIDNINAESIMNLNITYNPQLSTCEVQSVCDYLSSPNGTVEIHNNAPGCNSQLEVEEACTVGVPETTVEEEILIYPNPFTTFTTIEYELEEISNIQFTIYNAIGEIVYMAEEGMVLPGHHTITWSPGHLPAGLYYAVLRSEKGMAVVKMIKQ